MTYVSDDNRKGCTARLTGLEPATSTVTGWHSYQLSYSPIKPLREPRFGLVARADFESATSVPQWDGALPLS